ncbi:MAG: hypothetical protein NTZ05_06580 [Chloroflexi bacterium]|nr:hypothetical protein [Chloroflexota bacterium]
MTGGQKAAVTAGGLALLWWLAEQRNRREQDYFYALAVCDAYGQSPCGCAPCHCSGSPDRLAGR